MTTQEKIDFYFVSFQDTLTQEEWENIQDIEDIQKLLQKHLTCEVLENLEQLENDFAFVVGPDDVQLDSKEEVLEFIREYGYELGEDEPEFLIVK